MLLGSFSLSALQFFSPSAAAAAAVTSTISAATVYTDRAVITRTAHVDLPAGESVIALEKLPANLLPESLQVVNGDGSAAGVGANSADTATILDIGSKITRTTESNDPEEADLLHQLEDLQKQDRPLLDQVKLLDRQRTLLLQIETAATRVPEPVNPGKDAPPALPAPTFDEWQKLLEFSQQKTDMIDQAQRSIDQQREAIIAKIKVINAQLEDRRGQRATAKSFATVTVRLVAKQAGPLDLAITYTVPNAGWTPIYDAHLLAAQRQIKLEYAGLVRNSTGEDWKDIHLTLSTARPALGGSVAEPEAWIVDVARPEPVTYAVAETVAPMTKAALSQVAIAGSNGLVQAPNQPYRDAEKDTTARYQSASVDNAMTSATFKVERPVTIAADNAPQREPIATLTYAALLQYQAMPRASETAYLTAYVDNGPDVPLLAGTLNAFLGDNFIAAGRLPTVMPSEHFHLDLGADEGIAIKRRLVSRLTEDTGFIGKQKRITYEYLVTITNHKSTTERIMFKDVLPTSRDERIVVKLIEPAERELTKTADIVVPLELPKPGITREEDGKIVWRADLAGGEKREFKFKFTVEYPADIEVSGL